MTYRDEALEILELSEDLNEAAAVVYEGNKGLTLYVIAIGLEHIKARHRRTRRRELRKELQPEFTTTLRGTKVFTDKTKEKLKEFTRELFGDDGWMIGDHNIGIMTKEELLAQAESERASAKGLMDNAYFYEALAEPLAAGQQVSDYWTPKQARRVRANIENRKGEQ